MSKVQLYVPPRPKGLDKWGECFGDLRDPDGRRIVIFDEGYFHWEDLDETIRQALGNLPQHVLNHVEPSATELHPAATDRAPGPIVRSLCMVLERVRTIWHG